MIRAFTGIQVIEGGTEGALAPGGLTVLFKGPSEFGSRLGPHPTVANLKVGLVLRSYSIPMLRMQSSIITYNPNSSHTENPVIQFNIVLKL